MKQLRYTRKVDDNDVEEKIHEPLRRFAVSRDYSYMVGAFHAVAPDFAGNHIGRRFAEECCAVLYSDGIRRGVLAKDRPCFAYGVIDDPSEARRARDNSVEVVHLHRSSNAVCLKSNAAHVGSHEGCVIVRSTIVNGSARLLGEISAEFKNNLTTKSFNTPSKL